MYTRGKYEEMNRYLAVKLSEKFVPQCGRMIQNSKKVVPLNLFETCATKTGKACASAVSQGAEKAEQVILKEHGLSEIISETAYTPVRIGQTPVHSPLRPKLPEHYIKVEGEIIPYEYDAHGKLATSYTITPSNPYEYMELTTTRHFEVNGEMQHEIVSLGQGKKVQFYSEDGLKVGAVIKVPRTSKASKEETLQWIEELKNKRQAYTRSAANIEPTESWLEKTIKSLQSPKGAVDKVVKLDGEGNTVVSFLDKNGSFMRRVHINPDGHVVEYSDFSMLVSGQWMEDACLGVHIRNGLSSTGRLRSERLLEEVQFEERMSKYMQVRAKSRYMLDYDGNVTRTIQTRKLTPHEYGKIGEEPIITTVDTRSMGNGKFVEDVVITRGDKRFEQSFYFDQETGNVHRMDGWCKGLTKEEIEILKSDPFLASRHYIDGLDFVRVEKFNAYKMQGLRDKQTPLTFTVPTDPGELGHYKHRNGRHINLTPKLVKRGQHSEIVSVEHHEPKHGFQHQMVDDLDAGLLQGEEKAQAEIFRDEFSHYHAPEQGFDKYYNQEVEADARRAGEYAQKQYEEFGKKTRYIFFPEQ